MRIPITYIDTSDADYRDWQLDPDQPMLICIDCYRLVPRHHPMQHRCEICHQHKQRKTPRGRAKKRSMKQRRERRERQQTVHDESYRKPRTWIKSQELVCAVCRRQLTLETAEVDHVVPLSLGGENHPRNYQVLCHRCHEIKTLGDSLWTNVRG